MQEFYDTLALKQDVDGDDKMADAQFWGAITRGLAKLAPRVSIYRTHGSALIVLAADRFLGGFNEGVQQPKLQQFYDTLAAKQKYY